MSTRMGMADARCTSYISSRIYNDELLTNVAQLSPYTGSEYYRYFLENQETDKLFAPPTCSIFLYKDDYSYPK